MTEQRKPGDDVMDSLVRRARLEQAGVPIDREVTPSDRRIYGVRDPLKPLSASREAQIDSLVTWFEEQVALDGADPALACRRAVDAAMPHSGAKSDKLPLGSKVILWILALIVGLVTFPLILWTVGHVVVPAFRWGMAWT